MSEQADFIEGVVAGISGAFGDYKNIAKVVEQLRRGGVKNGKG